MLCYACELCTRVLCYVSCAVEWCAALCCDARCCALCPVFCCYLKIFAISDYILAYFALTTARISLGIAWCMHRDGLEPKTCVKIMKMLIHTAVAVLWLKAVAVAVAVAVLCAVTVRLWLCWWLCGCVAVLC